MKTVTVNGTTYELLPYEPEWSEGMSARIAIPSEDERGLTGRSSRTPLGRTVRIPEFQFILTLERRDGAALRAGLARAKSNNTKVLCPFWPGAAYFFSGESVYAASSGEDLVSSPGSLFYVPSTGEAKYADTALRYTFEPDGSASEIHTGPGPTTFSPSDDAITVPLLVGHVAAEWGMVTNQLHPVRIEFTENSTADLALVFKPHTFTAGPAIGARTPLLFPLLPDWSGQGNAFGGAEVEITREAIGQLRETADAYYPQTAERDGTYDYLCFDWEDTSRLIRFFVDHLGSADSFWLVADAADCDLTQNTDAGSAVIHVDDVAGVGDGYALALIRGFDSVVARSISSKNTGAGTITLGSSPGALPADETIVSQLVLSRFQGAELEVTWSTTTIALARVRFIEVPPEAAPPAGETVGTTLGALPVKAYLYRFTSDNAGAVTTWRYAAYERAITWGAETFAVAPFEHDDVTETIELDGSECAIKSRYFAGHPLWLLRYHQLEATLELEILECEPDADGVTSAAETIFRGRVSAPKARGPYIDATVKSPLTAFERMLPRWRIQPGCGTRLFATPCGLNRADWAFTAVVVSYTPSVGATLVLNTWARTAGLPSLDAHYFAGGWIEFGAGTARQARSVYESTAIAGGSITLTLGVPFTTAPAVGASITVYPGCDRTAATCSAKFGNYRPAGGKGFRGFPYVPTGNLTFAAVKSSSSSGKK